MEGAGLQAHLRVSRPSFALDLELVVQPGEVVALLGPNGAGKSTALRALAGLEPASRSVVRIGGTVLDDPERRISRAPQQRGIGVVFQDYLLFENLTARDNIAFGLRARGVGRRDARAVADDWLDRVGLSEQGNSKPRALSGGQAQRVALARALAFGPDALLLDEPLAALDARTRTDVRTSLAKHLREYRGAAVIVTHDPLDAMVLADRLVVIENGAMVQSGAPQDVARRPRTDYVAELVGLNLLMGQADGEAVAIDGGGVLHLAHPTVGRVQVALRPSSVALYAAAPSGSPRNVWIGTVTGLEPRTDVIRVTIDGPPTLAADVTLAAAADLRLQPGTRVWCSVKATELEAYPA
ncbi:MAG: transporter ATP-binding protein [Jatrophihabitantaceae bacterium]|nr:transporter ATP-binding protein [Jatrophihabitantaceae bacterium]